MIDEDFDTEFETRLRITLSEMIPKLAASTNALDDQLVHPADLVIPLQAKSSRRVRRLVVAVLAVAATVLGLTVIARRDADELSPADTSPVSNDRPPQWYELIRPSLPDRFSHVALTLATDSQLWFVAISPGDAKTLEIQLAAGGYSTEATTTVDVTGEWVETAQGWSVKTPAGLFVSVACDVGARGRDFAGPPNYCDMASTGAFGKAEIRAVVNALATSLTTSVFDQPVGTPQSETIDASAATALIAAAVPDQQLIGDTDWGQGGSDHIYDFAKDPARPDTSVRIVQGVYPPPPLTDQTAWALYDDAGALWVFGSGGVGIRISTTDPRPESMTRLDQLARDILKLSPAAPSENLPLTTVGQTTTTIAVTLPCETGNAARVHPEACLYVLAIGDFPSTVANRFKVAFEDLLAINGWTLVVDQVPEFPAAGTVIRIPPGWTEPLD